MLNQITQKMNNKGKKSELWQSDTSEVIIIVAWLDNMWLFLLLF